MLREQAERVRPGARPGLYRPGEGAVGGLPLGGKGAGIGRVPDGRVGETPLTALPLLYETRRGRDGLEIHLPAERAGQNVAREIPPDGRGDLQRRLLPGFEPVDAAEHELLEVAAEKRTGVARREPHLSVFLGQPVALAECPGDFLRHERIALGFLLDEVAERLGDRLAEV